MFALAILLTLFFLPTIIAAARSHQVMPIFLLNFFLGWTVIGWFIALIWSVTDKARVIEYVSVPQASR